MRILTFLTRMLSDVRMMAVICLLLLSSSAMALFTNDIALTVSGNPFNGSSMNQRMVLNPVTGKIGLAYIDEGQNACYAEWQPGASSDVTLNEYSYVDGGAYTALGLAYDTSGNPHVGYIANVSGVGVRAIECVKSGGTWSYSYSGLDPGYIYCLGSYAMNPTNNRGAFCINSGMDGYSPISNYVYYNGSTWTTSALGAGGVGGGNDLCFSSTGSPFVVYPNDTAYTRVAGVASPANLKTITGTPVYEYLTSMKVTRDPTTGEMWVAYVDVDWYLYIRKWTGSDWGAATCVDNRSSLNAGSYATLGFAIAPNGDKAIMYPVVTGGNNGIALAFYDHTTSSWTTETLTQEGDVTGLDVLFNSSSVLYGLYNTAADTQFHVLYGYEKPIPIYMKVTMNNQVDPVVINVYGYRHNQTFLPMSNVWQDGLHFDESYTGYPENLDNFLTGNESSPWIDMAPFELSSFGDDRIQFMAMQEYTGYGLGFSPANFTIKLSSTPSDDGLFKTFTKSGAGSGIMVVLDTADRANCKDDLAYSQMQEDWATLLSAPGSRPVNFPVVTESKVFSPTCTANDVFSVTYQSGTISNETNTLSLLGINSIDKYDSTYYGAGFQWFGAGSNYFYDPYIIAGDKSDPDPVAIGELLDVDIAAVNATGHTDKLIKWSLFDEPASEYMEHIASCTVCTDKFRLYLQKMGYAPQDFGYTAWTSVYPWIVPTGTAAQKKLYYHTAMFRCRILTDLFKVGTDHLKQSFPTVRTCSNFCEEPTYNGFMITSGVDMYDIYETGGETYGYTENWLPYVSTKQVNGYMMAYLRSATHSNGYQFGTYNCQGWDFKAWDNQAKKISAVGQGAQTIQDYNWGPYYTISVDQNSQKQDWYAPLKSANYAIGGVENYLLNSTKPKSKIAILYSQATDAIYMAEGFSAFGFDNEGIWLMLTHLGYPVDIVSEKQVASGILADKGYKMLICNARYLLKSALVPLENWITAGGTLYMGPGALTYDEWSVSLGFDTWAGMTRAGFVYSEDPGYVLYTLPELPDLMPVTDGTNSYKSLCGYQKMSSTPAGATVHATFSGDGKAACWTKYIGAGSITWSGFFQGLAYQRAGVDTKLTRDISDPDFPTYGSTDWPLAQRDFFQNLVNYMPGYDTAKHASTNNYLVEAQRLESTATSYPGSIIAVMNWTGGAVNGLQVAIPQNGNLGAATTVVNNITNQSVSNGIRTVTLNMSGPIEFIKLPPSGNAPTVSITSPTAGTTIGDGYNITATAADSGGAITKVDFYAGDTLLGTDSSSPYSYSWASVYGGEYTLTAVATDNTGNYTTSAPVKVSLWNTADVGNVGITGSASYSAPTFTVAGAGDGIKGTADAFRFVYQQTTENCTITARVASWPNQTDADNRAGVMMRQLYNPNDIEASSLLYCTSSAKRVYFHRRTTTGGSTTTSYVAAAAPPQWVRVKRVGNTIKTYKSVDGLTWTYVSATAGVTVTMNNPIMVGLAVTSGTTASAATATFDNVSITRP